MKDPKEEQERKEQERKEQEAREREKQDRLDAARKSGGLVTEAEVLADYDD